MKQIIILISCLLAIMHTSYGQQTTTQPINNNQNKIIMNNQDYTANIVVEASPAKAYNAIKNFRAWWSEEIDGQLISLMKRFSTIIKIFTCVK